MGKLLLNTSPWNKNGRSSWWKQHLKILNPFKLNFEWKVGTSQTILLWYDKWLEQPLILKYPQLHSFAINDTHTVASWITSEDPTLFFHTPSNFSLVY